jgi:alkylation response protein AidB-like acyl-CoA dehydrogenase
MNADVNVCTQELAVDLLGADALAWSAGPGPLPREVRGFLRSRANRIEGGTSEVNRTILGERVLGLPREPDPHRGAAWADVPRS